MEKKQVLSVSKRPVTLKQVTSRLYLKIMTVILVWMSLMQYPPLPCQYPNLLVIVNQVRWAFTLKHKVDGSIDRYKARFVAKGYTQTYGVDYLDTFAPVAKLNTVRVLLSLAANHDWPLLQFDVKNAFLHGDLNEEIYMDLPLGIPVTSKEGVMCKLQKSLYGLKQSPRAWFGKFAASMKKFGNVQSNSYHTLFLKRHKGKLTALIIYVDDMIVTGDDHA
ncbi:unnamed protein product [Prunus armeniaca]